MAEQCLHRATASSATHPTQPVSGLGRGEQEGGW